MSQITAIQQAVVQLGNASTLNGGSSSASSNNSATEVAGKSLPTDRQQHGNSVNSASLDQAVVKVNDYLQSHRRTLEFSVDKSTQQTVIKVIDQATGKTLRQIPPEYMIRLAQTLQQDNRVSSTGIKIKT